MTAPEFSSGAARLLAGDTLRLLSLSHFEPIFGPLSGRRVGLVDGVGNVGDHLIYAATRQLLDAFGVDWIEQQPGDRDEIEYLLLFGGGNMGSNYLREMRRRQSALRPDVPSIVLPQSWMSPEPGPYWRCYVRERRSLTHCPDGVLAPDLAHRLRCRHRTT
ncbi:MAG: hypothetical protein R3B90_10210 [Planctomycetaceae bacterium]